jgi:hypothetical protein
MQKQDYEYFLQNTGQFYKEYGPQYLVIKNKNVIGAYANFDDALGSTMKKESLGTFLIQECLENREKAVLQFQDNVRLVPTRGQSVEQQ